MALGKKAGRMKSVGVACVFFGGPAIFRMGLFCFQIHVFHFKRYCTNDRRKEYKFGHANRKMSPGHRYLIHFGGAFVNVCACMCACARACVCVPFTFYLQGRKYAISRFRKKTGNGQIDGRTDRRTDRPAYRDARTHLKTHQNAPARRRHNHTKRRETKADAS